MQIAIFTPELNSKNTNDRITGLGKLTVILRPREFVGARRREGRRMEMGRKGRTMERRNRKGHPAPHSDF